MRDVHVSRNHEGRSLSLAVVTVLQLLLSLCLVDVAQGTVYVHNATGGTAAYPSLPALFGAPFEDNRMYEARLQYLVENPFLCEEVNFETTSFVNHGTPVPPTTTTEEEKEEEDSLPSVVPLPMDQQDATMSTEVEEFPVVLLAARGQCPFHYKAMVAESLGSRVDFLIIYNHNADGEDVLVPMYSEYGSSRLKLLSVTHRTGLALKRYIANASAKQKAAGGPMITMDAMPPEGIMTAQDLQDVLISTLGLFFMLVSFSGCFLMCAAAAQQRHGGAGRNIHRNSPIWMLLVGDPDADPVMVGDPAAAARAFGGGGRSLLTRQEVEDYLINRENNTNTSNGSSTTAEGSSESADNSRDESSTSLSDTTTTGEDGSNTLEQQEQRDPAALTSGTHCAICIDDFDENSTEGILTLPCNHKFHTDCIVPWLTERQSKCPLCKFDVFHYVQEIAAEDPSAASGSSESGNSRRRRQQPHFNIGGLFSGTPSFWLSQHTQAHASAWMAVAGMDQPQQDDDEEENHHMGAAELEMTETPLELH